jgi:hypothetical protein
MQTKFSSIFLCRFGINWLIEEAKIGFIPRKITDESKWRELAWHCISAAKIRGVLMGKLLSDLLLFIQSLLGMNHPVVFNHAYVSRSTQILYEIRHFENIMKFDLRVI